MIGGFVRKLCALLLALLAPLPAHALTRGSPPYKMGVPWGQSAGGAYIRTIPVPSQIGITNCAASYTDGFPPLTFLPSGSGGCPPFGQDMNGILSALALGLQWAFAGGTMNYDATFQTQIGGYPQGALVQSNILIGRVWRSTVDNNVTNPDDQTGATVSWAVQVGTNPAGTPIPSFSSTAPPGSVLANGSTVGNASSNATLRANVDTYWLFSFLWTACSACNMFNSGGGSVGRGATAIADWNANRQIATPDMRGRGVIGVDVSTSRLTGVPVINGSTTTGASALGENTHALTVGELASHSHTITDPTHSHGFSAVLAGGAALAGTISPSVALNVNTGSTTAAAATGITGTNATGSGTAHNNVEQSLTVYWYLQL